MSRFLGVKSQPVCGCCATLIRQAKRHGDSKRTKRWECSVTVHAAGVHNLQGVAMQVYYMFLIHLLMLSRRRGSLQRADRRQSEPPASRIAFLRLVG